MRIKIVFTILLLMSLGIARADDRFASAVVSYANLPGGVYGDANNLLGKPSTVVAGISVSLICGAWGQGTLVTLGTTVNSVKTDGEVVVKFDQPIYDDPRNWYGKDFLVFGNAVFTGKSPVYINATTDMSTYYLANSGAVSAEQATVSVSQDGINWYSYSSPTADNYFPTNAFTWNAAGHAWDVESDWTKPVNPSLTASDFGGKSAADAIALYDGSAGGAAFDLSETGFAWIQYIKVSGFGADIDGFSRVSHAPASVTGRIVLADFDSAQITSQEIAVDVRNHNGQTTYLTIHLETDGSFALYGLEAGAYDISFKASHWLRRTVMDVQIP